MSKVKILLPMICFVTIIEGPISSKWKECGCSWVSWESWSACTKTCGGGIQQRMRQVRNDDTPNCTNFTACATNDMGWETQACHTTCYGGGVYTKYAPPVSSYYGHCVCPLGRKGSCCENSKYIHYFIFHLTQKFLNEYYTLMHSYKRRPNIFNANSKGKNQ